MNDDELILRRKRQNADRARAYRKRKKGLAGSPALNPGNIEDIIQSDEPVSDNNVAEKILHLKQLNAERCRRYRQKCKRLKSGASSNQDPSDSDPSTCRERKKALDNVHKATQVVSDKQLDLRRTYKCNECDRDIFGCRYVCVQCVEHHVCATCEARGAHALHYVLRVPADKPHYEAMAILEKIREIVNIEKRENQDIPLGELESIKREVDTPSDPLEVGVTVKVEPQEFSEFEFTQTDDEISIKGDAQPAEPKKRQQRRKRKMYSSEKHTDSPAVTLPNTQIRISLDRVTEVTAKRNRPQSIRVSSNIINETPLTYEAPADIKANVNAPRIFDQTPGFVVPIIMYNVPKCEDRGGLRTEEMHTLATSSSQAMVVSFDPLQPAEDLVIKTELPD